ncbi:MAG: hypothetical protein J0L75_10975 [Spirochaetes bacterium]|nr:hypothetical protein [Spirochaetota bacterium]
MAPLAAAVAAESASNASRYTLLLTGARDWKETTVTFPGKDWVMVPDPAGKLQDPLDDNRSTWPLAPGAYRLEIIRAGKKHLAEFTIDGATPATLTIPVRLDAGARAEQQRRMEAVTVSGLEARKEYARSVITAEDARMMPGAAGDVIRSVVNQPGVVKTSTYASGMFIRGGELEDLAFSYDAIRIGSPFHVVGVNSAFPALSIESLNFYSGVPPLRFSTSLAAIEVLSKTRYDKSRLRAEIDVNLAAAGFYISIPAGPNIQISFGARRTYYEFYYSILRSIPALASLGGGLLSSFSTIPFFYDLNAKIDWNIGAADTLSLVFIQSLDQALFDTSFFPRTNTLGASLNFPNEKLGFENQWNAAGLVWSHDTKTLRNKLTVSRYYNSNSFADFEQALGLPTQPGSTENWAVADSAFWRVSDRVALELGAEAGYEGFPFSLHQFRASPQLGLLENLANLAADTNFRVVGAVRTLAGAFFGAEFATGPLLWNAGARVNWNSASGQFTPDPRAGVTFKPSATSAIYLRGGRYSAYPILIETAPAFRSHDLRSPFTWQAVAGGQWSLGEFEFKTEAYAIRFYDQILVTPDGRFFTNAGDGTSYGAEAYVKKNLGKTGTVAWFNYAFNKADRSFFDGNTLVWSRFRREVPHSLSLIVAQGIPLKKKSKLIVGSRLAYSVGRAYTGQTVQVDANTGGLVFVEDAVKFQKRLPNRFTWDLKISWDFPAFKSGEASLYLDFWSVEGIFGLKNATYAFFDAGMVNPANAKLYDPSLKAGSEAPVMFMYDIPPMPILGFKVTF